MVYKYIDKNTSDNENRYEFHLDFNINTNKAIERQRN